MSTEWKPSWAPGVDPKALSLSEEERRLAAHLDGESTAEELALLSGLPRVQVAAALEKLLATGSLSPQLRGEGRGEGQCHFRSGVSVSEARKAG